MDPPEGAAATVATGAVNGVSFIVSVTKEGDDELVPMKSSAASTVPDSSRGRDKQEPMMMCVVMRVM